MAKTPAIIVDLDGTLYDSSGRKHYVENKKNRNFDMFHKASSFDQPNEWCQEIIDRFMRDHHILFVSGRPDNYRQITNDWLEKWLSLCEHDVGIELHMRAEGDYRPDTEIKKEIYENHIKDYYEVLFVIDDRKSVVDMWRNEGLTVLHCAEGNF